MYTIDQYVDFTRESALYPDARKGSQLALAYVSLGLAGEAGEVANKVKKIIRGDVPAGRMPEHLDDLRSEAGDVLWYLVRFLDEIGSHPISTAWRNELKLRDRLARDAVRGSGDER